MALNLEDAEADRLARELARLTGERITTAVTTALRERLERVRRERAVDPERLLRLGRAVAERLDAQSRTVDHGALLYDERGLPR